MMVAIAAAHPARAEAPPGAGGFAPSARAGGGGDGSGAPRAPEGLGGPPAGDRPLRYALGLGWSAAPVGPPAHGPIAYASILPGGAFGAGGAHVEVRGQRGASPRWVVGGLSYEAGAVRPHLKVDVRAEAGAEFEGPTPLAGGGARWQVWMWGPVAVSADAAAHLWLDGVDTRLVLSGALALGVAN